MELLRGAYQRRASADAEYFIERLAAISSAEIAAPALPRNANAGDGIDEI